MKVYLTERSKDLLKVSELPIAQNLIKTFVDDKCNYDKMAATLVTGTNNCILLKQKAEISKNCRIWDAYHTGSKDIDIWVNIYVFAPLIGFYDIGFYVTDMWDLSYNNREEIKSHMFIEEYKRV